VRLTLTSAGATDRRPRAPLTGDVKDGAAEEQTHLKRTSMRRARTGRAITGLALGMLTAGIVGCGTTQPSVTFAPSPVAASPTVVASTVATPVVADEPRVECEPNTSIWTQMDANGSQVPIPITLTCENAVAAARRVVGPDPALAYIEFHYGGWCPPGARCAALGPSHGYVIVHTKGLRSDVLVAVTADAAGKVTASDPRPLAPAAPAP
jgi:hypothetical protein